MIRPALQRVVPGGEVPQDHPDVILFDRWTNRFLASIEHDTNRTIIATYIAWHHRRRLTTMIATDTLRPFSTRGARQQTRVAAQFLAWLTDRAVTLEGCRQADIDHWFSTGPTTRMHTTNFLVWARSTRRCPRHLRFPNHKPRTPTGMPRADRVELVAHLLHDDTLELGDRVAGLLVALYAQPVSRICRIGINDIDHTTGHTTVIVHTAQIELDNDTANLLRELMRLRIDHDTHWLFPGRAPDRPIAAKSLTERLNRVGISCHSRVGAFHELATQIPSPILAELIGYNPHFLAERAAALGTPWQTYAAIRYHTH